MTDANSTSCSILINDLSSEQTPGSIVHDQPPPSKLSLSNGDIDDKGQSKSQSGSRNNVESTQPFVTVQLDRTHSINEIRSYHSWSLFNALCCCLCFGIRAWLYGNETEQLKKQGNFQGALKTSRNARHWNTIATVTGLSFILLYAVSRPLFHMMNQLPAPSY